MPWLKQHIIKNPEASGDKAPWTPMFILNIVFFRLLGSTAGTAQLVSPPQSRQASYAYDSMSYYLIPIY